ncbi:hypothetical protein OEA41_010651 [Lepraria neglecta]|uniref:Cytochrome P450 n=1 Tax=Lepraria neglecta TaxID=209136 RepID=A0AAD9YX03_9LECA|nr:hypothetical protein OEA41_010651 [Lepraria neglecta]
MLDSDEYHFTVRLLQDGMNLLGPLSPVPWLVRIGYSVPYVAQNFKDLLGWSAQKLRHRMKVMSWLLEASEDAGRLKQDEHWLRGDSFALIVAGSDTVASTLISIFYHLADDPTQTMKLRAELDKVDNLQDSDELKSMAHLNGMINEALRLHPALPSGGLRETPPEGLTIAGHFIPGNVTIVAPRYSLGRRK